MLSRFFEGLDRKAFLNFQIWEFSYRSFFKEYARLFFLKAVLLHSKRTVSGLRNYQRFIKSTENLFPQYQKFLAVPEESSVLEKIQHPQTKPLVGLGFCLKPYDQEDVAFSCPVGRANHECLYLEEGQTEAICSDCTIYKISKKCLNAGCIVYIMTSAKDIATDFLLPQIRRGLFPTAILLLCPYSVQAILPSLFICGAEAFLMAYDSGYCQDFKAWRRADLGVKEDMTKLAEDSLEKLLDLLDRSGGSVSPFQSFRKEGNIFYPE